jgi:hypothetical protein
MAEKECCAAISGKYQRLLCDCRESAKQNHVSVLEMSPESVVTTPIEISPK